MTSSLQALHASSDRLRHLTGGLSDEQVASPSYCDDWSIAQVLSHLGSGAVIARRTLQDARSGSATPDDFNQSVWDEWNAKTARAQADEALVADAALVEAFESVPESERSGLSFPLGPLSLGFDDYVGLRLNEHVFHTWDIAVALDDTAVLPEDATALVVDNLGLIARFSGRPDGQERTVTVRTTDPQRHLQVQLSSDGVQIDAAEQSPSPDLVLPSEALSRLVYGRLQPDHVPPGADPSILDSLRAVFPGP